ncbi:MAG: thiolase family protein [Bryobacteraceae bacterium]
MKKIYIAAYHPSRFGKLMGMTVPEILRKSVEGCCREISTEAALLDCASVGAACNFSLNEQGLLAGLMAQIPGLESKPMEAVENACASGGQAVLSVVHKMLAGLADTGIAVGYEKMRDAEGKMDGKLIGKVLGYFSHPDEREGKVFVFPHIFAEIMKAYMDEYGATERDFATIAAQEYSNANHNPCAQMQKVKVGVDDALRIEGFNRYVVDGLPLKTYDCSQITDGYAALILATEEGLAKLGTRKQDCVELAGFGQAVDPLRKEGRDVLRPAGANRAMQAAYERAGLTPADINVAEIHDCFTVMGAIGTEVIGKARPGEGAQYWVEGKAAPEGECGINTSGGLVAKGHPIGATGIAMIGWAAQQLLGKAPPQLQVRNARAAATFNIGGPVCASVCTVLKPAA